ncbi:MAG: hypothetical protein USCAAHI_02124 [Beijerinckiaceae bacterium]|nr:MAG: hypothetical protein USCAAHI_02124 [Beijerinckiaceae bacterium]
MQDKPSAGPGVIALPPLILAAAIAAGLILHFFWPAKFLPRALAVPLGILIVLGAVAIAALAVLEPEEAYLERHFGEEYLRYKAKVRRWI